MLQRQVINDDDIQCGWLFGQQQTISSLIAVIEELFDLDPGLPLKQGFDLGGEIVGPVIEHHLRCGEGRSANQKRQPSITCEFHHSLPECVAMNVSIIRGGVMSLRYYRLLISISTCHN